MALSEKSSKPAGIRTHVLVSLAACLICLISAYGFMNVHTIYPANINITTDPARLVVGILTGIGFLGEGIIWKSPSGSVQGITTAAEIFLLATLGIAAGLGQYFLLGVATVIAFVTMLSDNMMRKYKSAKKSAKESFEGKTKPKDEPEKSAEMLNTEGMVEKPPQRRQRQGVSADIINL